MPGLLSFYSYKYDKARFPSLSFSPKDRGEYYCIYIPFNPLLTYTYLVRIPTGSYTNIQSFSRRLSPHSNTIALSLMSAFKLDSLPGLNDVRLLPLIEPALLMPVFPRFPKKFPQQYLELEYLTSSAKILHRAKSPLACCRASVRLRQKAVRLSWINF